MCRHSVLTVFTLKLIKDTCVKNIFRKYPLKNVSKKYSKKGYKTVVMIFITLKEVRKLQKKVKYC